MLTQKQKTWILAAGSLGLAGGLYLLTRKREQPLPPEPSPPPPPGIPEIDSIFEEIDQAIAKLREIIEFLRQSVEGADELVKTNDAAITNAQNVVNEIKPKVDNKTATQQDAEKLLLVLEKIIAQFNVTNAFLVMLVSNVKTVIQELEDTVNNLEKQINELKYQLEPVLVQASVSIKTTGYKLTAIPLSIDQDIMVNGQVKANGALLTGSVKAIVCIRDKSGNALISWTAYSHCWHSGYRQWACDGLHSSNISQSVRLVRGTYVIEASIQTTDDGGEGEATATVSFKTARFLSGE